jgi:dihydrofolate reductase
MTITLTIDLFASVDGFAGSDGLPGYFGYYGPDLGAWIDSEAERPHTVLMGRRTYEMLAALPEEHRDEAWEAMSRRPTVVFTRTLHELDWPAARACATDPVEEVHRLRSAPDARSLRTTGSLSIVRQLLEAQVVDRLRVLAFPVLAGPAGREPAFAHAPATELELVETRMLDGRIQLTEYRPTGRDIPRGTEQRAPGTGA